MPCPHWRQTRTRLYGLHDMMNGIHCLSWGIDVFAMRYNVIISSYSSPLSGCLYSRLSRIHQSGYAVYATNT